MLYLCKHKVCKYNVKDRNILQVPVQQRKVISKSVALARELLMPAKKNDKSVTPSEQLLVKTLTADIWSTHEIILHRSSQTQTGIVF